MEALRASLEKSETCARREAQRGRAAAARKEPKRVEASRRSRTRKAKRSA